MGSSEFQLFSKPITQLWTGQLLSTKVNPGRAYLIDSWWSCNVGKAIEREIRQDSLKTEGRLVVRGFFLSRKGILRKKKVGGGED